MEQLFDKFGGGYYASNKKETFIDDVPTSPPEPQSPTFTLSFDKSDIVILLLVVIVYFLFRISCNLQYYKYFVKNKISLI
jgi:hypothetical protein